MSREPGAPLQADWVPLCVPEVRGQEWTYVKECLDTGWVSSVGSYVDRFEREMAAAAGTKYAVAVVNGTAALHVALMVAGVQPGDEVLTSDLTFIAPVNAIRYANAHPVLIDAEPRYWQMDVNKLALYLSEQCDRTADGVRSRAAGRRIAAILPVHILGGLCDLDAICEVAKRYNLPVIEDSTEALGSTYKGRPAGSIGSVGCFSFNGNKIITTGGGGMLVTNDEAIAKRARYLTTQAKDDAVEFIHGEVGYNYRLTNVLAAIGCAQLEQLPAIVEKKRAIAAEYGKHLHGLPGVSLPPEMPETVNSFWMYTVRIDAERAGIDSRAMMAAFDRARVQTRPLWQPMHLSPAHSYAAATDCAVAAQLNRECLSLPCSAGLTSEQQQRVIDVFVSATTVTPR